MNNKLKSPPRHLNKNIKRAVYFGGINQLYWGGMLLAAITMFYTLFNSMGYIYLSLGDATEITGKISSVKHHYDDENNSYTTEVFYTYLTSEGFQQDSCETPGKDQFKTGTEIQVKYATSYPGYAQNNIPYCSNDLDNQIMEMVVMFAFVLGLGLVLLHNHYTLDRPALNFLKNGIMTTGRQIDFKKVKRNDSYAYIYTWEYDVPEYSQKHKLKRSVGYSAHIAQSPDKQIIYDPQKPQNSIPFDEIKGGLEINDQGKITSDTPGVAYLIVPAMITLSPIIGYIVYKFNIF